MTWADIHLFVVVEGVGMVAPASAAAIAKFPRIEQLVARVAATPKIADYLKKRAK